MRRYRALAPAKVNLGLFVGPVRAHDGRHELVTVMQSISLADELTLELGPDGLAEDEVLCPGVPGPPGANLAAAALAAFREHAGWDGPPARVRIDKRIPVAAGLAGGSADAAATLRLARLASGLGDERALLEVAGRLGADVPAQVEPGRWLASGAGERLARLPAPRLQPGVVVLALQEQLSTAAVFAQADRLGLGRSEAQLRRRGRALAAALAGGEPLPLPRELLHNDLQRAAVSLCPAIAPLLEEAGEAGADFALVSGSGPTVLWLFAPRAAATEEQGDGVRRAQRAIAGLRGRAPAPLWARPVDAGFGRARAVDEPVRAGD